MKRVKHFAQIACFLWCWDVATHYVMHTSKAPADKPAMVLITGNYSQYLHSKNSKKSKQSKKSGNRGEKEGRDGGRGWGGCSSATDILIVNFSVTAGIKKRKVCFVISLLLSLKYEFKLTEGIKICKRNILLFFPSFLIWKSAVKVGVCWFLSILDLLHFRNLTIKNPSITPISSL